MRYVSVNGRFLVNVAVVRLDRYVKSGATSKGFARIASTMGVGGGSQSSLKMFRQGGLRPDLPEHERAAAVRRLRGSAACS